MATLFPRAHDEAPANGIVTAQCDVCAPPFIATCTPELLRSAGWLLPDSVTGLDICHVCARRLPKSQLVPRRERLVGDSGGRLPNVVIIGAAKAATTSLHAYLGQHPDIAMSDVKEWQFFCDPAGVDWLDHYRSQFNPDTAVAGESSTMYTRAPAIPGVAERMHALIPDARLIYMVRDPIDRAIASYIEERMHTNELRDFDEAFAAVDLASNPYVAASCYAYQLGLYLDAGFSLEQVKVVDMRDLSAEPDRVLRELFTFLGVDPEVAVDTGNRLNERSTKKEYAGLVRRLRSSAALKALYRLSPEARERILGPVRRMLARPIESFEPSDELRARLIEVLAPDAAEFRRITGLPFTTWSV